MTIPNNPKNYTPSYEACMEAYKHILPTVIEIAKKRELEKQS